MSPTNAQITAQVAVESIIDAPSAFSTETVDTVLTFAATVGISADLIDRARDAFDAGKHWTEF